MKLVGGSQRTSTLELLAVQSMYLKMEKVFQVDVVREATSSA